MNADRVAAIASAVLYEGYLLYPYRPSALKNRQRFNFGVLAPPDAINAAGSGSSQLHTECLARVGAGSLSVRVRFLHLMTPDVECAPDGAVDTKIPSSASWQQAVERDVVVETSCRALHEQPVNLAFVCGDARSVRLEPDVVTPSGMNRDGQQEPPIRGEIRLTATALAAGVSKISVHVSNLTPHLGTPSSQGETDHTRCMVSTHVLLHLSEGEFISLLDPPAEFASVAAACQNTGVWPVLVGDDGERDTMLAAPIILYDYPQIAPESPGDFFDGTEIDEMLVLRILTMTDREKEEMRASDPRARRLLQQTEALPPEHVLKLHGVLRRLSPQV